MIRLTSNPSPAISSTTPPVTGAGSNRRPMAETAIATTTPIISTALINAPSTSARCRPNEWAREAGRRASQAAIAPIASDELSVNICPASDISASEPDTQPPTTSTSANASVKHSEKTSVLPLPW